MKKETKSEAIARLLREEGFDAETWTTAEALVWLNSRAISTTEVQAALPFAVTCKVGMISGWAHVSD